MSALISRDPFARTELHRAVVRDGDAVSFSCGCDWCGLFATVRGRKRLFRYWTERDDNRRHDTLNGRLMLFCSKACRDAYHG